MNNILKLAVSDICLPYILTLHKSSEFPLCYSKTYLFKVKGDNRNILSVRTFRTYTVQNSLFSINASDVAKNYCN